MLVGREGASALKPRIGEADLRVMETLGIAHLKDKELADCSLATQQRTEIARAIARSARIFLFDEPNSALTDQESDELFREMRRIADSGRIVILVTHRLSDLVENARRVAVIRDGVVRAILEGESLTEDGIARQLVVGGAADTSGVGARAHGSARSREEVLSVSNWSHAVAFRGIDFRVRRGEIVALIGVEGSGARELLRSLRRPRALHGGDRHRRRGRRARAAPSAELRSGHPSAQPLRQLFGGREPSRAARLSGDRRPSSRVEEKADASPRDRSGRPLPREDAHDHAEHPIALRRQPAEGRDRAGAELQPRPCFFSKSRAAASISTAAAKSIGC